MELRAAVFDFDGTLADTFEQQIATYKKILPGFGSKEIEFYRENGARELIKKMKISLFRAVKLVGEVNKAQGEVIDKAKPFTGIKELVEKLRQMGVEVGILTSNREENVDKWLSAWGIVVDWVRTEKTTFNKDRAILKVKKPGMIYVGDEIRDVEACKKAGVKIVAAGWGFNTKKALERAGADYVVETPAELRKLLLTFSQ